MIDLKLKKQI